ncbi:MAG: acyltransferase, partial [Aristaeellaceae bacterium]
QIGDRVRINSGRRYNPIGGDTSVILNSSANGQITIGEGSGLSNCTIVARKSVTIGKDVRIGGSTHIYDTDFHAISFEDRILHGDQNTRNKPVVIEDGAFIGCSVLILKGVTIGRHSVIGAGSVVAKDVPAGEIWAGNPARFIRKLEKMA